MDVLCRAERPRCKVPRLDPLEAVLSTGSPRALHRSHHPSLLMLLLPLPLGLFLPLPLGVFLPLPLRLQHQRVLGSRP